MKKILKIFLLFASAGIITHCSSDTASTAPIDDTLPKKALDRQVIRTGNMAFRKVPLSDTTGLWVSETEVTCSQYAALTGSPVSGRLPMVLNWYDALRLANRLSFQADSLLGTDTAFAKVYDTTAPKSLYQPRVIRYPALSCITDSTLIWSSPSVIRQQILDSVVLYACSLGSISLAVNDTTGIEAVLGGFPDSLSLSTGGALRLYPCLTRKQMLDTVLSLLPASGNVTLRPFRHAYHLLRKPGTVYNGVSGFHGGTGSIDTLAVRLYHFSSIPPLDSLRRLGWAWYYPQDTLNTFPDSIWAAPWKRVSSKSGFRLPTAAEWEHLALCGTTITYSTYNGGLNADGAVYGASSPSDVAGRQANPYYLYDVTGNLSEWTESYWTGGLVNMDTTGFTGLPLRVLKGGWFGSQSSDSALKSLTDISGHPDSTYGHSGVRLVSPYLLRTDSTLWRRLSEIPQP